MATRTPQAEEIFRRARDLPPEQRGAFLNDACGADAGLRARVESLLRAAGPAGSDPDNPAPELTTTGPEWEGLGAVIGSYKLLQQIGEGGFGIVFMAEQQHPVRRKVALKVLKPGMDTRQVLARFEAERQALALMDHPNIARVFDAGTASSGRPYFVMELVRGVPITAYCDQNCLTPRERLDLFVAVCQAIQHAHQKGIIHRDLKPSNVLVTLHDGRPVVKVIDFGIAKATGQQLTDKTLFTNFDQFIGTPLYMSPEQAAMSGLDIDTRSDIYSLGVLLYELLTGTTPFERERFKRAAFDEIRRIIREEEPPRPSTRLSASGSLPDVAAQRKTDPRRLTRMFRGELDWVVMKALEKDRNRRYESASAFATDVMHYLADEPVAACPPSAVYRVGKFVRRNRVLLSTAGLVAAALLLGTGVSAWQAVVATRALDSERRARADLDQERSQANRQISDALVRIAELRAKARASGPADGKAWTDLREAVQQADALARGEWADPALAQRVEALGAELQQDETDRRMLARLEELGFDPDAGTGGKGSAYAAAFAEYGLPVLDLSEEEAARKVAASPVRDALVPALDDWAARDEASADRLLTVARGAQDDPWYRDYFDARRRPDRPALARLARRPETLTKPPRLLTHLARALAYYDSPAALNLVRQAQVRYPDDVWVLAFLGFAGHRLQYESSWAGEEASGFRQAALAVRPRNWALLCLQGQELRRAGRKEEAIRVFQQSLALRPDNPRARAYLALVSGELLQDKGKLDEAPAALQEALRHRPDDITIHGVLGAALDLKGVAGNTLPGFLTGFRKALRAWRFVPLGEPYNVFNALYLGRALARAGKVDEAAEVYAEALVAVQTEPSYWPSYSSYNALEVENELYRVLVQSGRLEATIAGWRQEIQRRPGDLSTLLALAVVLEKAGRPDEALTFWRGAARGESGAPLDYALRLRLGTALARAEKWDEAVAVFRGAMPLAPGDADAHFRLGNVLEKAGRADDALVAYQEAIRTNPTFPPPHTQLLDLLDRRGRPDALLAAYRDAVRLGVFLSSGNNTASTFEQNNRIDTAIVLYREDLRANPGNRDMHLFLARLLEKKGLVEEALAAYGEAIRLDAAQAQPAFGEAHDRCARLLEEKGRVKEAVAIFRDLSRRLWADLSPPARAVFAEEFAMQRNDTELLPLYRAAIVCRQGDAGGYQGLAGQLAAVGLIDEAVAAWKEVIRLSPKDTAISTYRQMGDALEKKGRVAEALAAYREGIRAWPNAPAVVRDLLADEFARGRKEGELVAYYRAALDCAYNAPNAYRRLAEALARVGLMDRAAAVERQVVHLFPGSRVDRLILGNYLESQGRLTEALAVYRDALRVGKDLPPVLRGLFTEAFIQARKEGDLLNLYRAAANDLEDNTGGYPRLGMTLAGLGLEGRAIPLWKETVRLNPGDLATHRQLADALGKMGRTAEAAAAYRDALRPRADLLPALLPLLGDDFARKHTEAELLPLYRAISYSVPRNSGNYQSLGAALAQAGLTDEAITVWKEGVRFNPRDLFSWRQLADALVQKGRLAEAVGACRETIRSRPDLTPALRAVVAEGFAKDRSDKELVTVYRAALDCFSGDPYAYLRLGEALAGLGLVEQAVATYREVRHLPAGYSAIHQQAALVLIKAGKLDEAICFGADLSWAQQVCDLVQSRGLLDRAVAACRDGIKRRPDEAAFHLVLGLALERQVKLPEALAAYSECIRLRPKSADALLRRGMLSQRLGQGEKALADYTRATEVAPQNPTAWSQRATYHVALGRWDNAVADFSRVIELNPQDAAAWSARGNAYAQLRQWDKAAADFSRLLQLAPYSLPGWVSRGNAFTNLAQYEKAVADYSRAIEMTRYNPTLWSSRASALVRLGEWAKAAADYSEALRLNPADPSARTGRAGCYQELGKFAEALADLRTAFERFPTPAAHNQLAWFLATCPEPRLRDPARAVELAGKAVQMVPRNGAFHNTLGVARYRAGDWAAAVEALTRSTDLNKGGDSSDHFFLAMAHWQLGQKDQAHRWFTRGAEWLEKNQPKNAELRRFRAEAAQLLGLQEPVPAAPPKDRPKPP